MPGALQQAYLLHRRPYRETSLLLEVFTRNEGRKGLVARGARRGKSPRNATLQAFQALLLCWSGRGELGTLTNLECSGQPMRLSGKPLLSGFYLNELLMRLLHRHEPHPGLFDAYHQALSGLHQGLPAEPVLRLFETRLLGALGYGLNLTHCIDTDAPLDPGVRYHYQHDRGAWLSPPAGVDTIPVSGATLLALHDGAISDAGQLHEAKHLLRQALGHHLGDKPLQSRRLFR